MEPIFELLFGDASLPDSLKVLGLKG